MRRLEAAETNTEQECDRKVIFLAPWEREKKTDVLVWIFLVAKRKLTCQKDVIAPAHSVIRESCRSKNYGEKYSKQKRDIDLSELRSDGPLGPSTAGDQRACLQSLSSHAGVRYQCRTRHGSNRCHARHEKTLNPCRSRHEYSTGKSHRPRFRHEWA